MRALGGNPGECRGVLTKLFNGENKFGKIDTFPYDACRAADKPALPS